MRFLALVALSLLAGLSCASNAPPMLDKNDVVLFQGDSITDVGRDRAGDNSLGEGYVSIVVERLSASYPDRNLKFINRGISGNRVTDLAARWQTDTLDLNPDFLSILVGINDTFLTRDGQLSVETFEQIYDNLLADTLKALPRVKIVLGEPFLLPVVEDPKLYAAAMMELKKRQEVVERLARKYHLPLIRYQRAFDEACRKMPAAHWSEDGVHPTHAGHELMADEWLKTVNQTKEK
jgi:lysophospholipase L1-like esterase